MAQDAPIAALIFAAFALAALVLIVYAASVRAQNGPDTNDANAGAANHPNEAKSSACGTVLTRSAGRSCSFDTPEYPPPGRGAAGRHAQQGR
jgi:hypothetical protein